MTAEVGIEIIVEADPEVDVTVEDPTLSTPVTIELIEPTEIIEIPADEPTVILTDEDQPVSIQLTEVFEGPVGPRGLTGAQGAQGETGVQGVPGVPGGFSEIFYFAHPATVWPVRHDLNTMALSINLFDLNGEEVEGEVVFLDSMSFEVRWYYPEAGSVRIIV